MKSRHIRRHDGLPVGRPTIGAAWPHTFLAQRRIDLRRRTTPAWKAYPPHQHPLLAGFPEEILYGGWRQSKDHHPLALRVAREKSAAPASRS
jgi:hypothetical protein